MTEATAPTAMQAVTLGAVTEMLKTNIAIGLLALAFFANAQYQGWNLFESDAAQTSRVAGNAGRAVHK